METSQILYAVEQRIATITLNRPEVMNAFSDDMRAGLLAALHAAQNDSEVRVVVITGAGKAFCAGGDIANMVALQAINDTSKVSARLKLGATIVQTIRNLDKPVIAAINGAAAGAGMNLALACDLRYSADHAVFSESFVKIGLIPDWAGHYLLQQIVGTARALELMMLGERISANDAYRLGLVNQLFPLAELATRIDEIAQRLARSPRQTLAEIKQGIYLGATMGLDAVLKHEGEAQLALFLSNDAREGMQAFIEKRPPRFE